jgi:lipopolysaccharide assembly outer membrane protein LptD (OstA)
MPSAELVVAEGNVEARFQGWRLLADRVEVIEPSRTVYATGRLRLYKGDQMLQASRLRYSQLEGTENWRTSMA